MSNIQNLRTGIDFVPPMNANPFNRAQQLPFLSSSSRLQALGISIKDLPTSFSWRNEDDREKHKRIEKSPGGNFLSPPMDQGGCGSCWAISSASVLGDRLEVKSDGKYIKHLPLSPTILLSCSNMLRESTHKQQKALNNEIEDKNLQIYGCGGAAPLDAIEFMYENGTVSAKCWPYTWCSLDYRCGKNVPSPENKEGGENTEKKENGDEKKEKKEKKEEDAPVGDIFEQILPQCQDYRQSCFTCDLDSETKKVTCKKTNKITEKYYFYAKKDSGRLVVGKEQVKVELFMGGPVVATYAVFDDMVANAKGLKKSENYVETDGIYIHHQKKKSPYKKGDAKKLIGFHSVAITGWGEKEVKGYGKVPYWEVRNSWGTGWNEDGYFLCAMSNSKEDINVDIAIDKPFNFTDYGVIGNEKVGGVTIFDVDPLPRAYASRAESDSGTAFLNILFGAGPAQPEHVKTYRRNIIISIIVFVVLIVLVVGGIVWYFRKQSNQKMRSTIS